MELEPFVRQVQRDLATALPEDSAAAEHAERLAAALDSSLRLSLISALGAAADELSADLAPAGVSLQLRGGEPSLVTQGLTAPSEDPEPPAAQQAPLPVPAEDEDMARFNLRLPESLKAQAEERAAASGQSLNSWLIRAVAQAVATEQAPLPPLPPAPPSVMPPIAGPRLSRQRVTGWMN